MFIHFLPTLLFWYLGLLTIGLIFLPLNSFLFRQLKDKGYLFSKILGLAVFSYLFFLFNVIKIVPFTIEAVWGVLFILGLINWGVFLKKKGKLPKITSIAKIGRAHV